jgi:integrase/recombinase XerD
MEASNLDDFVSIYQKFAVAENKSPRTIETVTAAVRHFDNFLAKCPDIHLLKPEDLRQYIRWLQQRTKWEGHPTIGPKNEKLSPHSIACVVRSIRSFTSYLTKEGFLDHNPFEGVKTPKAPRKPVQTFTNELVDRLLRVIPHRNPSGYRDLAIIIVLYGTGLRISELLGVRMDDIDFDSAQIRVMGKGGRERAVYMSAKVFKVLFKYVAQWRPKVASDYVFVHADGRPLSRFYVAHRLRHYGREAGITKIRCSAHTLRHSFAVNYLRNGGDPFTLQKILGHSTLEMTRHYAELSDTDVQIKQKAFSPAEKLETRI